MCMIIDCKINRSAWARAWMLTENAHAQCVTSAYPVYTCNIIIILYYYNYAKVQRCTIMSIILRASALYFPSAVNLLTVIIELSSSLSPFFRWVLLRR